MVAPSIKDTVLAQFKDAEVAIIALAEKYRAVAFDVTTTKGMNEAKAARLELREKGRFAVQRAEKSVKADVNDLKRVMADEVERLVSIVQPVEDAIDAQIKAEEERKAREKAERERIEAARVAGHQERMAKISGYLAHCQQFGMTAARIQVGIDKLAAATFGPDWQEFAVPAADLQCRTLEAMRALHAQAVEREAEAARLDAQRIENERVAAELAEQQRQQAEAASDLKRQADELAAAQAALAEKSAAAALQAQAAAQAEEAAKFAAFAGQMTGAIEQAQHTDEIVPVVGLPVAQDQAQDGVAENPVQPQPGADPTPGDVAAEDEAVAIPQAAQPAPPPAGVTLTPHQRLLSEACDLLDSWVIKPPAKKQAAECFALVASLRDRAGLPRAA